MTSSAMSALLERVSTMFTHARGTLADVDALVADVVHCVSAANASRRADSGKGDVNGCTQGRGGMASSCVDDHASESEKMNCAIFGRMALSATEASLERLQHQVHSGSCGIAAACSRVENILQALGREETGRPFVAALPRVLAMLVGDPASRGSAASYGRVLAPWTALVRDTEGADALYSVLRPGGTLFRTALSWTDGSRALCYDAPVSAGGVGVEQHIAERVGVRPPAASAVDALHVPGSGVLRVEAAEYVLLRVFAWLCEPVRVPGGASGVSGSRSLSLNALFASSDDLSSRDRDDALAERVLGAYLSFMLPVGGEAPDAFALGTLRGATGVWTCARTSALFGALVAHCVLWAPRYVVGADGVLSVCRAESLGSAALGGHVGGRVNGQVGGPMGGQMGGPMGVQMGFQVGGQVGGHVGAEDALNGRRLRLARMAVARIVGAATGALGRPAGLPAALSAAYDAAVDGAFRDARPAVYRLARVAVSRLPSDRRAVAVCGVLLAWLAPWASLGGAPGDEWAPYVRSNYVFAHVLIGALLADAHAAVAGFASAADAGRLGVRDAPGADGQTVVGADAVEAALGPHVHVLSRVLAALAPFFPDVFWAPGGGSAASPCGALDREAAGEQLEALEDASFVLEPLFDDAGRERAAFLAAGLAAVRAACWPEGGARTSDARHAIAGTPVRDLLGELEAQLCAAFRLSHADLERADEQRTLDALSATASTARKRRGTARRPMPACDAAPSARLAFKKRAAPVSHARTLAGGVTARAEGLANALYLRALRVVLANVALPPAVVRALGAFRIRARPALVLLVGFLVLRVLLRILSALA